MPRASDPIVESRTITERVCPTELLGAFPVKPAPPAAGTLDGDEESLGWVGRLARWGEGLLSLLLDAKKQCA